MGWWWGQVRHPERPEWNWGSAHGITSCRKERKKEACLVDGILRPGGKGEGRSFPMSVDPQLCVYAGDDGTMCILQGGKGDGGRGNTRGVNKMGWLIREHG